MQCEFSRSASGRRGQGQFFAGALMGPWGAYVPRVWESPPRRSRCVRSLQNKSGDVQLTTAPVVASEVACATQSASSMADSKDSEQQEGFTMDNQGIGVPDLIAIRSHPCESSRP